MTTCDEIETAESSGRWRIVRLLLFCVMQGAAVILVGFAALFLSFEPVWSAENPSATLASLSDARSGSLLLKTDDGYADATRLGIDVDLTVSGPTVRARVTQIFRNPTKNWVEATYVYPLPAGGAVDTLKMVIGDRVVVGDIKERQQARIIYEQAQRNGQKAALTEQERPNIFTNSVANIGPGETVLVQIEYQEPVQQMGNEFSLRVPMVVGPRYNPAPVVQSVDFRPNSGGWGVTSSDPVPDHNRISPPVLDPAEHGPVNPTAITVRLQAGFPLGEVKSHHHQVKIDSPDNSTRVIRLAEGVVPADRDFELSWKPAAEKAPSVGLFREHVGDADYLLAFVTPPSIEAAEQKPLPREVIFVIDNSGSMGGTSIIQAKASLTYALGRLQPNDRFNVIRFDHTMDVLFPHPMPADAEHVANAKSFVGALQAEGGTEMVPAMQAALTDNAAGDANTVRQVVFLTDGAIGNEQQLFDTITAMRGRSRVFMVGIGSAPNTFLMTRAAELGRGAFTPYRFGRAGRGADARPVRQARKSRGDGPCREILRGHRRPRAGGDPRPLSRRAAGSRGETRHAQGLGRDQGPDRRPALGRDACPGERRRRQGSLQAVGAAQDRQRRDRAHPANRDARGRRQDHPGAGAAASAREPVDQSGRGRRDPKPSRRGSAQAQRIAAQPAGGLGFCEGVWRAPKTYLTAGRAPRRRWRRPGSSRGREAHAPRRHAGARHRQVAEDGNRCRTQDDHRVDPAGAQPDPVRVQPTSDVPELTPDEGRSCPPSPPQSARGLPPTSRAARAAFLSCHSGAMRSIEPGISRFPDVQLHI
jgi:Vault protein inter-alpha-trypsin domain/von Willebrand factor type A domain